MNSYPLTHRVALFAVLLSPWITSTPSRAADSLRSELRDNGPVFFGTIRNRSWETNTTMKGIVVKLGTNDTDYVCYDEDLLRVSLVWGGAFLSFPNKGRERIEHPQQPEVAGVSHFGTVPGPGWSKGASFVDPRPNGQGPLPRDWAKYRGVYLHENQVVLHYTVGTVRVLELPGLETQGEANGFTRTIEIGASSEPMSLVLVDTDKPAGPSAAISAADAAAPESPAAVTSPSPASGKLAAISWNRSDELTAIKLIDGPSDAQWMVQGDTRIVLQLPASATGTRVKLLHWTGSKATWKNFQTLVSASPKAVDLAPLITGGAPRWTTPVEVKGTVGTSSGPYQLDTIPEPNPNPWNTKNYLSGFDFFADGRAAVASFHGDVWIVGGLDGSLGRVFWKRFATGLFQPLGLKIIGTDVYVTCRDGLIRLRDLNRDGEADSYESFNNDTVVTPNYHEFCLDLDTDSAGNFYYAKGAPWPPNVTSPHQGTMIKISRDGTRSEIIATGLRAPNGLAVGPHDEVSFSDNEGHYIPTSKISMVKPGNLFYGMVQTAHRPAPTTFEQPFVWLPKAIDNSSGGQVWVNSDRWGALKGQMLFMSYGKATLFSVLQDKVEGELQGGVVQFPFRFPSGVMRARFNPVDGQLYLTGLRGWQTAGVRDGGFFRVRYTGKPLNMPITFHAKRNGVELTYDSPLSPESAKDLANWGAEQWNYIWSSNYGSPEISANDGRPNTHDQVEITAVTLRNDNKTVFLEIPKIKPVMQMKIRTKATTPDGSSVAREVYLTLHKLAAE